MTDTRFVYGARCTWFGPIAEIGKRGGIPACPHCGSPLYEMPNEAMWWRVVDKHEAAGNPGYRAFVEWLRGKHFPTYTAAQDAYSKRHEAVQ
nr:hypothetical protein [uncultured Rhodopila sp.]